MSITSDEVNYLVFRYLQESGFHHTAFAFSHEGQIGRTNIDPAAVAPGALVSYLQKGLQYASIEAHLNDDGTEASCDEPFGLTIPHTCNARVKAADGSVRQQQDVRMEDAAEQAQEIPESQVTTLRGHTSEVFICAWCPTKPLLASGSGDATSRIWDFTPGADLQSPVVLRHTLPNAGAAGAEEKSSQDVTTLDWNVDGTLLATGSYDGQARVWSATGELQKTLVQHQGPVFSLKWNCTGECLLSGSVDKTAIVWDTKTGDVIQKYEFHTAPTLDVDWRDATTFATCSSDKYIYVAEIGKLRPLKIFEGHEGEVNSIKWDPSGSLLASCSDDFTAKIWDMNRPQGCVHSLQEHTKEIYTIKWGPSPNTKRGMQPPSDLILASASFDAVIKLWNVEQGRCIHSLTKHIEPVYSVAFSPNGQYLASGSFDCNVHIWSVRTGKLIKTHKGTSGIFEVCWNAAGDRVAACYSNSNVCVIDIRM
eukprot:m51a1_g11760 hypothetical protein (479) ;mRNA; r:223228-225208